MAARRDAPSMKECRGGLWPPAGMRHRWRDVGAACGRSAGVQSTPLQGKRASTARPYRGNGGRAKHAPTRETGEHSSPLHRRGKVRFCFGGCLAAIRAAALPLLSPQRLLLCGGPIAGGRGPPTGFANRKEPVPMVLGPALLLWRNRSGLSAWRTEVRDVRL